MPIFHIGSKLGFFAHVPKCAGSAIENYLAERFGPLAFIDHAYRRQPANERWTKSSPQHLPISAFERLFPPEFFACSFAVVRHPVDRLLSAFQVQRDLIGRIPVEQSFSDWLKEFERFHQEKPWYLDNHTRKMCDMVPEGAQVFHLEQGLDPLIGWLDAQAGNNDGPRTISRSNTRDEIFGKRNMTPPPKPTVVPEDIARIAKLFAQDFDRFGYDPKKEKA